MTGMLDSSLSGVEPANPADARAPLFYRTGHFVLESGMHTDCWFDLDGLFVDSTSIATAIESLSEALSPFDPWAICGPLLGGAFLAQRLALRMGARFIFSRLVDSDRSAGLFGARYSLPHALRGIALGKRVAVVDDMISAGSSVRATVTELEQIGAIVVAVGTLYLSGDVAASHFASRNTPLVAIERRPLALWPPTECPLCRANEPITHISP
jgi:orotate phosphoribosyltransferase